jgi:Kef-type K+ transport system membrane component KefB
MPSWSIDFALIHAPEVQYLLLVCGLFIVPRFLQRFRIPSAITCAAIGAVAGIGFGAFQNDSTIQLLSLLGIVSMFLFAGLEVEIKELREGVQVIAVHLVIQSVLLVLVAVSIRDLLHVNARTSILYALALVTPSTGFILDSLHNFGLVGDQGFWVKSKSIAAELLALLVLFVTIQSQSLLRLLSSGGILVVMVFILPKIFRIFAKRILPFAPNSEFAFLVVAALVCAAITRRLGVYYLVGAFLVGIVARRFRQELPEISSTEVVHSLGSSPESVGLRSRVYG